MTMSEKDGIVIRCAKKEDMRSVAEMIQELADFEKMPDGPKLSMLDLERDGFESEPPAFRCKVAESLALGTNGTKLVGFALYFPTYSTWEGRAMMLEDLYVRPTERKTGVGLRLFNAVADEAVQGGCTRLDFHVLEWNDARSFYERLGAVNLTATETWCFYRLTGEPLRRAHESHSAGEARAAYAR